MVMLRRVVESTVAILHSGIPFNHKSNEWILWFPGYTASENSAESQEVIILQ